ncbi:MAG: hypothetical protein KDF60_19210 [Calditrichaeota bacterium]|nr:hypothetical protein [Calditrichota bacterium]
MYKYILFFLLGFQIAFAQTDYAKDFGEQNWTNFVRTAGHGLSDIDANIKDAQDTHLFGIEVDNSLTGYYESFLDPTEKLAAIKEMATRTKEIGNHAFVYTEGLETITADAAKKEHTFFKDHPDWLQRDINDRPAVFGGGTAFWISQDDEDVWISPYAVEWRKIYMERIRQIAATGIDGIFIDIPYWMTHFDGWEDTWASFDVYTVEAFKKETGLDAKKDLKLGDFSDANFRKWVDFRIKSLTDFMADVAKNARSVNPDCKTIAEIYPGLDESAVRVGADVYEMYDVVDVVAHEYSGGGGDAASKNPDNWFNRMIGMYTFRSFAEGKASWMLSYSWSENKKVEPMEPIKNLALSNLMAGTNNWDARGHVMSGSNHIETRKEVYKWIAENENTFYKPRNPMAPIGIYFSPKTRNYHPDAFMESFEGMMKMMLQGHMEFQVVTPRTLENFKGNVLILPDVRCVSKEEAAFFEKYLESGKGLVFSGETGRYDETGNRYEKNIIRELVDISRSNERVISTDSQKKFIYYPQCPGKIYTLLTKSEFNEAAWESSFQRSVFFAFLNKFKTEIINHFKIDTDIKIEASPFVSTQTALVESKPHVFIANFAGLKSDEIMTQTTEKDIKIQFKAGDEAKVFYLPFLGEKQRLDAKYSEGWVMCKLPPIEKGGVVWLEN